MRIADKILWENAVADGGNHGFGFYCVAFNDRERRMLFFSYNSRNRSPQRRSDCKVIDATKRERERSPKTEWSTSCIRARIKAQKRKASFWRNHLQTPFPPAV
ncbi:hypothetical protein L596_003455 [Steinernema carpocapsae]|uniref:Uncharacterized protein n=1 Tax=Steinernema carpocapsae TaxID=34508 RepID=A0A4V6I7S9_STECR|nr:hypothetical protein L596_003455 [Steinernema carpocapsae]